MIHIFTSVVNRPDFVILQDMLFKKFLKNEYTFHIVDDSVDPDITEQFEIACSLRELQYYRKPLNNIPMNPAQACAHTIQWSYDNLIKKNHFDDIVFFTDSDMFLIDEFDIEEYMSDAIIGGLPQGRGHITYMWNGIMFFNMPKIDDKNIDFSEGMVEGQLTDVGGHTYYYFKKTGIELKGSDVQYPTHYYDIDLQKDAGGYNMELHLNGNFLHYRAATNWHSNWKGSDDPLQKKTIVFKEMMNRILQ
jgi:hypothetical protein